MNNAVNVVNGRRYKITFNFIQGQESGQNVFGINVSTIGGLKAYSTSANPQSCETIISVYTAIITGIDTISLNCEHQLTNVIGYVSNITFLLEPLGY